MLEAKEEEENRKIMFPSSFDAWIQEAEEASKLLEDMETKINNNTTTPSHILIHSVGWNLLELAPQLDRLESLLQNPPAKPILTEQDIHLRREMLSRIQHRMKEIAKKLYSLQHTNSLPKTESKEPTKTGRYWEEDDIAVNISKYDEGLETPLVMPMDVTEIPLQQQLGTNSLDLRRWTWRVCKGILLAFAMVVSLVLLFLVVALI